MRNPRIVFFGSTKDSVTVLEALGQKGFLPAALVTQPAKPVGRKHTLTETPVTVWGKKNRIPVLSFPADRKKTWAYEQPENVVRQLATYEAELLISASYGQKIPSETISRTKHGGLNVHPSLLPKWRGADPVPWAILSGDAETGVSIVTLSEGFDRGMLLAQTRCEITAVDLADPLRSRLFRLGSELLLHHLPEYLSGTATLTRQEKISDAPYARRFSREDAFVPWEIVTDALTDCRDIPESVWENVPVVKTSKGTINLREAAKKPAVFLHRMIRALTPWPGVYTQVTTMNKGILRMKLLDAALDNNRLRIGYVQLEGKTPVAFAQFQSAYHPKIPTDST